MLKRVQGFRKKVGAGFQAETGCRFSERKWVQVFRKKVGAGF
jgi:hypothetical protein